MKICVGIVFLLYIGDRFVYFAGEYSQNLCLVGDLSCIPCNQRNPSCKGLPDGINAAPNALWSKTYIQCLKNRTLLVAKCKQGLFDPSHKSCVKYIDPSELNSITIYSNYVPAKQIFSGVYWISLSVHPFVCLSIRVSIYV